MKTTTRHLFALLVLVAIVITAGLYFYSPPTVIIGDEEIVGVAGFGATVIGLLIAAIACIFTFILTSAILAGVSALLIIIFAIVAAAVAVAVAPLCLPLLLVVGIVMLIRRKKAPVVDTISHDHVVQQ